MSFRSLTPAVFAVLCLSSMDVSAQGDETTTLREASEAFAQRLTDEGCEPAMSDWRAQIIAGTEDVSRAARMMGVMAAFEKTTWGPCFSEPNDRAFVVEGLMTLAIGPSPQGRVFGSVLLRESLGVDWRDQLAMTGTLPFLVQAAEAHLFCAPPLAGRPQFARSSSDMPVGITCAEAGVEDPSLETGLFYLALALQNDNWDNVQTALSAPAMLMMTALTDYGWDMEGAIQKNRDRGLKMNDPKADAAILRSVYQLLFDSFARDGGEQMTGKAKMDAAAFQTQPLDLSD